MKLSRRVTITLFYAVLVILLGDLFWPYLFDKVIQPLALVVWLLLRVFVLSIDQRVYWIVIIFIAFIFLFRWLTPIPAPPPFEETLYLNETFNTIGYWRSRFTLTGGNISDNTRIRRELGHLLASIYASKQNLSSNFEIYEDLRSGKIALPEHIHAFLFPEDPQKSSWSIKKSFQDIRYAPRIWFNKWSGRERAEHFRVIDEVLSYMESSMENKNES